MRIHTSYLHDAFNPIERKRMLAALADSLTGVMVEHPYDTIAFSGISGAAVAFTLADELGLPLINVRKDDRSHYVSDFWGTRLQFLEGAVDAARYVIVDDLIASGSTIDRIMRLIKDYNPQARCSGIVLYAKRFALNSWSGAPVYYGGA